MKKIVFLLPGSGKKPAGGFKVVYEYANRLVQDGFSVKIIYAAHVRYKASVKQKIKSVFRYVYYLLCGVRCNKWFPLDNRVKQVLVPNLNQIWIGKADYYVATAVETAIYLKYYNENPNNCLYLIQGFENWFVPEKKLLQTYNYGFKNITVSTWLGEKVKSTGSTSTLIKNGFDFNKFHSIVPPEERNPRSISMLYHKDERKGCKYGIEALNELKRCYPDLKVTLFGVPKRPENLPSWITYVCQPDIEILNKIYNESAIYLAPSLTEGWGLTVGEAMICGAAVVCTDTLGFKEMVEDGTNGIIVPIKNVKALYEAVTSLMSDNNLRIKLAKTGTQNIRKFNWEESYQKFLHLLSDESPVQK